MKDKEQISRYPLDQNGFYQQYILTRARDKSNNYKYLEVLKEAEDCWIFIQNRIKPNE